MGSGLVLPSALCQAGQVWPRLAGGMSNAQVKKAKKKAAQWGGEALRGSLRQAELPGQSCVPQEPPHWEEKASFHAPCAHCVLGKGTI